MKFHLLLILPFVLIPSVAVSESAPSEAQLALLGEEYNTMRQMRYRLKELLEQQEFADKLNQADDIFADFQQLEQWLAQLDENPESLSEVMEMLEATTIGLEVSIVIRLPEFVVVTLSSVLPA